VFQNLVLPFVPIYKIYVCPVHIIHGQCVQLELANVHKVAAMSDLDKLTEDECPGVEALRSFICPPLVLGLDVRTSTVLLRHT
jgi:hypothetical protein